MLLVRILLLFILSVTCMQTSAQQTQSIRGSVVDGESLMPLPGAYVLIKDSDPQQATSTDIDGHFRLDSIPVGRISIVVSMIGYDNSHRDNLSINSGKQLVLEIKMNEAFEQLGQAVITASSERNEAANEMATTSARSISVEETQRYAASIMDPARMAQNFAGVASGGDDIMNSISVRGNSPRGVLWRLEGVEIPNPNHFGDLGSSGGGISMLSASTLATSDFYTGAFPAEFGDATSAAFDLSLRNGNREQREYSFMAGILGIEACAEGYFSKGKQASYLINYRYSTLGLLSKFYSPLGDILPTYQDVSFKLNFPQTALGSFALFGLAGDNFLEEPVKLDSAKWGEEVNYDQYVQKQQVGVIGAKHVLRLNDKMYVQTTAAITANRYTDESIDFSETYIAEPELYDVTSFVDDQLSVHSSLNYKYNQRNAFKTGLILNRNFYRFKYDEKDQDEGRWINWIDKRGDANQWNHYAQWKHRWSEKTSSVLGYHAVYIPFTEKYSVEPRLGLRHVLSPKQTMSASLGLHSKPEHISTYFLSEDIITSQDGSFNSLEIPKALHAVLGFERSLSKNTMVKVEAYYQHHYDLSVDTRPGSVFSIANSESIWSIVGVESLVSEGTSESYGVDISLQRALKNGVYYMVNASIYNSTFETRDGRRFNSRYNTDYIVNLIGGKEWQLKDENKSIGFNTKLTANGGNRVTPINLAASIEANRTIRDESQIFGSHIKPYFRWDIGFRYKVNRERSTHTLMIDIQNATNRANVFNQFYDASEEEIRTINQTGLFPFLNYRIEFGGE